MEWEIYALRKLKKSKEEVQEYELDVFIFGENI